MAHVDIGEVINPSIYAVVDPTFTNSLVVNAAAHMRSESLYLRTMKLRKNCGRTAGSLADGSEVNSKLITLSDLKRRR